MTPVLPPPKLPKLAEEPAPVPRVHFRLWQITMCAVTVAATGYLFQLHYIAGLAGAFLAKHVLVAILAADWITSHQDR